MSKSRAKIDNRQLDIFEYAQRRAAEADLGSGGQMKCIDRLRGSIRSAIKQSPLSRHQIAGEMSHHLGETITKEMIDSWTRESDEMNGRPVRHIPAEYLPALCVVCGCNDPLVLLARTADLFVLETQDALRSKEAKLCEKRREITDEIRRIRVFLKEIDR